MATFTSHQNHWMQSRAHCRPSVLTEAPLHKISAAAAAHPTLGSTQRQHPCLLRVRRSVIPGPDVGVAAFTRSPSWSSDLYGPDVNLGLILPVVAVRCCNV